MCSQILGMTHAYEERQKNGINLIASENKTSPSVRAVLASDLSNRYVIPPKEQRPKAIWNYPNQKIPRQIVKTTENLACKIYGAERANVCPLSGNQIPSIILRGLLRAGDTFLSVGADCGGHFTTSVVAQNAHLRRADIIYNYKAGQIDVQQTADLVKATGAKLIFFDASMILFPPPLRALREAVGKNVIISYDGSHTLGLIAGGQFQDPLAEGADLLHGSTHKSLPGPQHGIIMDKTDVVERVRPLYKSILPLFVSSAHLHHIAALGIVLEEMQRYGREYASAVVQNARDLGAALDQQGLHIAFADRGYTDSHQIHVIVGDERQAKKASHRLEAVGIRTNAVGVPFTGKYGLRLGVAEITRRGMNNEDILIIARLFGDAVQGRRSPKAIKRDVSQLSRAHTGIAYADSVQTL